MTVNTDKVSHSYSPGSAMAAESIPFPFLSPDDVQVTHIADDTGARTLLAPDSDYTIDGDGPGQAATITAVAAWPADDVFELLRTTGQLQPVAVPPLQPFPARAGERALDRLAMGVQEANDGLSRAILLAPGDSFTGRLPSRADRAGQTLGFDADGEPIGLPSSIGETLASLAEADGAGAVGFLQAGIAAVARSVRARLRDTVSVKDFGALGNDSHDDTAAFNAAIAYLASIGGGELYVPPGTYKTTGAIAVNAPCISVRGDGRSSVIKGYGSFHTFVIDNGATSVISLYRNNVSHLSFQESNKTGGKCFRAFGFAEARFHDLSFDQPYDGAEFNWYNDVTATNIIFQGPLRCENSQRILLTSPLHTTSDVFTMKDIGIGGQSAYSGPPGPHAAHGIVIDGWCNTVSIQKAYCVRVEGNGYWIRNAIGADQPPSYIEMEGVETDFCGGTGIYLQHCTGCHISIPQLGNSYNARGIIVAAGVLNVTITGGQISDNGNEGLVIAGSRVTVTGVHLYSNGTSARGGAAHSYAGVYLQSTANNVVLNGVSSGPGSAGSTQAYGLIIDAAADYFAVCGGNFLAGNQDGTIANAAGTGATKVVANNVA